MKCWRRIIFLPYDFISEILELNKKRSSKARTEEVISSVQIDGQTRQTNRAPKWTYDATQINSKWCYFSNETIFEIYSIEVRNATLNIDKIPARSQGNERNTNNVVYVLTYLRMYNIALSRPDDTTQNHCDQKNHITSHVIWFNYIRRCRIGNFENHKKIWQIRNSIWRVETWKKWVCNLVEDFTMNPVS